MFTVDHERLPGIGLALNDTMISTGTGLDRWLTLSLNGVDRLLSNSRYTIGRQLASNWPTAAGGPMLADCWPHVGRQAYILTVGRQLVEGNRSLLLPKCYV